MAACAGAGVYADCCWGGVGAAGTAGGGTYCDAYAAAAACCCCCGGGGGGGGTIPATVEVVMEAGAGRV